MPRREAKSFQDPSLAEVAREFEARRRPEFASFGATLRVAPVRISHVRSAGEGVALVLDPDDVKTWEWWGDFESDLEVRRRSRFSRAWTTVVGADDVRRWLDGEARAYLERLSAGRPVPPIFAIDGADVAVFESVAELEKHLEAPYLEDSEFAVFDSTGRRLSVEAQGSEVVVAVDAAAASDPAGLEASLRGFLAFAGEERAGEQGCDLPCLVQLSRSHATRGFSRRNVARPK